MKPHIYKQAERWVVLFAPGFPIPARSFTCTTFALACKMAREAMS